MMLAQLAIGTRYFLSMSVSEFAFVIWEKEKRLSISNPVSLVCTIFCIDFWLTFFTLTSKKSVLIDSASVYVELKVTLFELASKVKSELFFRAENYNLQTILFFNVSFQMKINDTLINAVKSLKKKIKIIYCGRC